MTKEDIKQAARAYTIQERKNDKEAGYGVEDLRYRDLTHAFAAGAEWAEKQLVHEPSDRENLSSSEINHQLWGALCEKEVIKEKACEWLKRELAYPMPDELYKKWCEEKIEDFRKEISK